MSKTDDMLELTRNCVKTALAKGARQAAATLRRSREVNLEWRDGRVDRINEATTRGVSLELFVDGRYSVASSSDLRPDALATFIGDSVANTRTLEADPHRALPDPELYAGRPEADLKLVDARYADVTPDLRRNTTRDLETAARAVQGADRILSVTAGFDDTRSEQWRVASNGFEGEQSETAFWLWTDVSVHDPDGRRPEDGSHAGGRFVGELPDAAAIGREAAERALSRIGSKKAESGRMTWILDGRAASRLIGAFGAALSGSALQQKRSFLEGRLGEAIASPRFDVTDDPLVPKGFGSRLFDGEGIAARPLLILEKGVLRGYYIDTYYGRKLDVKATTGSRSNLRWKLGEHSQAELLRAFPEAPLITGFLGGNSNATTGDFSFGVQGFRVRAGQVAEPIAEMNVSGNHLELWKSLAAVGNDPFPYSTTYAPTLVFENVQFAGT